LILTVLISKRANKEIKRAPTFIQEKFFTWILAVEEIGLREASKQPGWHDEPLKGERKGQRSVRLNKLWRAIYIIKEDRSVECIEIIEVTPHGY
jgi:proteic killer suppression protein